MARLRRRRIEPDGSGGYTLIEVMVAMILAAIMVTSVFSVALTVNTGGSKAERKIKATAGARYVAGLLKNYVTGESGDASTVSPGIPGPCAGADNNWSITCNGITDTCPDGSSDCYALAPGSHTLTGALPPSFEAPPYNARVTYFVVVDAVGGMPFPSVSITTTWTEP